MAKAVVRCGSPLAGLSSALPPRGRLEAALLHVYDLSVEKGVSFYGVLSSPGRPEAARTPELVYRGEDCTVPSDGTWPLVLDLEDRLPVPEIRVEVWSAISLVNFLSNLEASAEVSAVPLLAYPGQVLERWFRLFSQDGEGAGMALLRMRFSPKETRGEDPPVESEEPRQREEAQPSAAVKEEQPHTPPSSQLLRPIDVPTLTGWTRAALLSSLGRGKSDKLSLGADPTRPPKGVGTVRVLLRSVKMHASEVLEGEHLVVVSLDGEVRRSHPVRGSSELVYSESFELPALHYRSRLMLTLVEARGEKKVGRAAMSVYAMMQRLSSVEECSLWDLGHKRCVGRVSVSVDFEEDWEGLFLTNHPRQVPPAPADALSVEKLREHLSRVSAVFQLYRAFWAEYRSIMQWEDPLVTVSALIIFVYSCLRINTAYFLSVPAFALIAMMAVLYLRRVSGAFRRQYIQAEPSSSSSTYRPVGRLRLAVCGFRNLSSSQIPALIRVFYMPYPQMDSGTSGDGGNNRVSGEKGEYLVAEIQQGNKGAIDITQGLNSIINSLNLIRSESKRDSVLQNHCDPWGEHVSYLYPVLQQLNDKAANDPDTPALLPWHEHEGCIKVLVHTQSSYSFSSIMDKEPTTGVAIVPIRRLVRDWSEPLVLHREVDEWVPVEWNSMEGDTSVDELLTGVVFGATKDKKSTNGKRTEVRLKMQLDLSKASPKPQGQLKELSAALVDLFTDSTNAGSTFSALWNMRENVQYVQNLLGGALDSFESFKNIFTWADPRKTTIIFLICVCAWIATSLVPSRWLILAVGLSEFLYALFPQPKHSSMTTRINNFLESIPNDADLRDIFAEERKHHVQISENERKKTLNNLLIRAVEECYWQGFVRSKREPRGEWEEVFLVVQSRRMVWYARDDDVSEGIPCEGQLLLHGHSGTTQPSPVELREIGDDSKVLSIFGSDPQGKPTRKTILCESSSDRDHLRSVLEVRIADLQIRSSTS